VRSPEQVGRLLAGQWYRTPTRLARLLSPESWPLVIPLARPPAALAAGGGWAEVRAHLDAWRRVRVGTVEWGAVAYRGVGEPIEVPVRWVLESPSEWVAASGSDEVAAEHAALSRLVAGAHPRYRRFLVERRGLVVRHPEAEVATALAVAEQLSEGCAAGVPLRALPVAGIDTKFFERNRQLMTAALDVRFDGVVSEVGLEGFLGAAGPDGHWLLVADLDGSLLPYRRIRLTDGDVAAEGLPGQRLLVVENERCLHALPALAGTVAVLGAGLNLGWLGAATLAGHAVGYWGDVDTWGLVMLARARSVRPDLVPLLMDAGTFDGHDERAVAEPRPAEAPVAGLTASEAALFARLSSAVRGRLEQELLEPELVRDTVTRWAGNPSERAENAQDGECNLRTPGYCNPPRSTVAT